MSGIANSWVMIAGGAAPQKAGPDEAVEWQDRAAVVSGARAWT